MLRRLGTVFLVLRYSFFGAIDFRDGLALPGSLASQCSELFIVSDPPTHANAAVVLGVD
jgi:hypothetical protein